MCIPLSFIPIQSHDFADFASAGQPSNRHVLAVLGHVLGQLSGQLSGQLPGQLFIQLSSQLLGQLSIQLSGQLSGIIGAYSGIGVHRK